MQYRQLGSTGLRVSEVGFGGWGIGGNQHGNSYGYTDDNTSLEAISRALDQGCNFFDTADVYGHGHSEHLLGVALTLRDLNMSDEVLIASKVGGNFYGANFRLDFSPEYIRFAVDQSLRRLGRDWLDLYQLHNPSVQQLEQGGLGKLMQELQADGKIRHWGVSVFSVEEGLTAIQAGAETIQIVYNVLREEAARKLFPAAAAAGVGVIAREPLNNGLLTGKYKASSTWVSGDVRSTMPARYLTNRLQAAEELRFLEDDGRTLAQACLRFALDSPQVSTVIVGCKTAQQVDENLAASDLPPLSTSDRRTLSSLLYGN